MFYLNNSKATFSVAEDVVEIENHDLLKDLLTALMRSEADIHVGSVVSLGRDSLMIEEYDTFFIHDQKVVAVLSTFDVLTAVAKDFSLEGLDDWAGFALCHKPDRFEADKVRAVKAQMVLLVEKANDLLEEHFPPEPSYEDY